MRRIAVYVAAWVAAGVGAVALATAGVSMVGNQVTGSRPSPLSADEVRSELVAEEATTTTTLPGTSTSVPGAVGTTPGGEPVTTTPTPPVTSSPGTTAPGSPTTTPPTTSPPPPPPAAETRTYTLVGGTATLRFSPDGATVVVASPNAGFAVDVEPTHDNGVRVELRSDSHRSRVEGWWDGGPRDQVEEQD